MNAYKTYGGLRLYLNVKCAPREGYSLVLLLNQGGYQLMHDGQRTPIRIVIANEQPVPPDEVEYCLLVRGRQSDVNHKTIDEAVKAAIRLFDLGMI